jgi:hypothetical protein
MTSAPFWKVCWGRGGWHIQPCRRESRGHWTLGPAIAWFQIKRHAQEYLAECREAIPITHEHFRRP